MTLVIYRRSKWLLLVTIFVLLQKTSSVTAKDTKQDDENNRYIFYDVHHGEGFNLRRDVFIRVAVMVHKLNRDSRDGRRFVLVLPPWSAMHHWRTPGFGRQTKIPWGKFFDVESIRRFVPVVELEEYLESQSPVIDEVLSFQHFADDVKTGHMADRYEFADCVKPPTYAKDDHGLYRGWFWDYNEMATKRFRCVSVLGSPSFLKPLFLELLEKPGSSVMLERAQILSHDYFGDENHWMARRAMRFSKRMTEIADEYRRKELNVSNDKDDKTLLAVKWEDQVPDRGSAKGGDYICVHLRRNDYSMYHDRKHLMPSLKGAAEQAAKKLKRLRLKTLVVATDAPVEEYQEFVEAMQSHGDFAVKRFTAPDEETRMELMDGGLAAVEQIVCSRSRLFVGTQKSTFSYRIQEEREILGFEVDQTFNMFCPDGQFNCMKPNIWKIKYPEEHLKRKAERKRRKKEKKKKRTKPKDEL